MEVKRRLENGSTYERRTSRQFDTFAAQRLYFGWPPSVRRIVPVSVGKVREIKGSMFFSLRHPNLLPTLALFRNRGASRGHLIQLEKVGLQQAKQGQLAKAFSQCGEKQEKMANMTLTRAAASPSAAAVKSESKRCRGGFRSPLCGAWLTGTHGRRFYCSRYPRTRRSRPQYRHIHFEIGHCFRLHYVIRSAQMPS